MWDSRLRAALLLLPLSLSAASRPAWIKLTSPNFEMYACAEEKKGREAILYFEQVRTFFLKALGLKDVPAAQPLRIVAFASDKDFEPYSPNEVAAAYYATDGRRDAIVMPATAVESYRLAVHEYTHHIVRHANAKPAIWFNEGLAEVYSTMKPAGKKVRVGDILVGHLLELRRSPWIGLQDLTAVGPDSPLYNEKQRAGVFYAESWALTHMLLLSKEYSACKAKVVPMLLEGKPAAGAFQEACGKSLAEVQQDLVPYVHGSRFFVGIFDIQLGKRAETPDVAAVQPLESGLVLANVLLLAHKRSEARARFEELRKEYPKSWEAAAGLAELAWLERNLDEARANFASAAELGSTDAQMYLDYASLEPGKASLARKALELRPGWQEAQYRLGLSLINEAHYQEAIDYLRGIKRVTPAQAFPYFYGLAYASFRLGQKPEADKYAGQARQWARAPGEADRVEQLVSFIHAKPREGSEHPLPARQPGETAVDLAPAPANPQPGLQLAEGTLRQVDCKGATGSLTIESRGMTLRFAIQDPNRIVIRNAGSSRVDFQCGPQNGRPILVEYVAAPDGAESSGEVRAIEFK